MGRAALIHRAGSRWREKTRNKRGRCRPQRGKRSATENRFDDRVMRRLEKRERQAVIRCAVIWMNKAFTHAYVHESRKRCPLYSFFLLAFLQSLHVQSD